jgi:multiple sugar transport system substrate-binding protein
MTDQKIPAPTLPPGTAGKPSVPPVKPVSAPAVPPLSKPLPTPTQPAGGPDLPPPTSGILRTSPPISRPIAAAPIATGGSPSGTAPTPAGFPQMNKPTAIPISSTAQPSNPFPTMSRPAGPMGGAPPQAQQAPKPTAPGTPPMNPSTPSGAPPASTPAEYKQSPFRFLPFILLGVLLLGLVAFIFTRVMAGRAKSTPNTISQTGSTGGNNTTTNKSQVILTYWGLWEPSTVLDEVISDYQKAHPNIKINYQQQSYQDYRERLQTAVTSLQGPDIFRFHASWVPMLKAELDQMPSTVYSKADMENDFYPIASQQLASNNQYLGVPLMYDGLGLYYNKDILRAANAEPPKTWSDLEKLAIQLTVRQGNTIQRGGVALGNANNVDHFSDILGLLMLQNGADPTNPTSSEAQEALTFYTNFYTKDKVWDENLPSSTLAFGRGDVAMMIAPSWRAHEIMSQYPNLSFGIASVPQLGKNKVTWASYWAEGVNAQSKHKTEAWDFLKYMSSKEVEQKFYAAATKERAFGEIYSRTDLAEQLANDPYAAAYLSDAPYAQDWYLNSFTHDAGLNDQLIKYYQDAVNAVIKGTNSDEAMTLVDQATRQVLRQYNIPVSKSTSTGTQSTSR